jgi:hypothetical protein
MPTIPPFMLKQLYQRGSLRNTDTGWEFAMRNHLASATLVGLSLDCDGAMIPPEALTVAQPAQDRTVPATGLSAESPLQFPVQVPTIVRVSGSHLSPGSHALSITAGTHEIGPVTIAVQDDVAG